MFVHFVPISLALLLLSDSFRVGLGDGPCHDPEDFGKGVGLDCVPATVTWADRVRVGPDGELGVAPLCNVNVLRK
jgi:hypothetical protein